MPMVFSFPSSENSQPAMLDPIKQYWGTFKEDLLQEPILSRTMQRFFGLNPQPGQ